MHTHGLIVTPQFATTAADSYGDNVFVLTFNSANGPIDAASLAHLSDSGVDFDYTDYLIPIPANHPSGLFWFHPHVHGISLNQLNAGMSGIITIGDLTDYVCVNDPTCHGLVKNMPVRHLIVKSTQLYPDGSLLDQPDVTVCT